MILKVPKKAAKEKLAKLTDEQRTTLDRIEAQAISGFQGQIQELEAALGMLRLGHHVGWKVLYIVHTKRTIRNYEKILTGDSNEPVRIRDLFKDHGPSSYRSMGFRIADAARNFWRVLSGESEEATLEKEQRKLMEK